ncbi:hypothetical protein DPEC_G00311500 [Dallia pectoralis]|uniref:Uncharacterized protein n=1 Tax=Dallia pectoralis TaxID=75939 RepID=A0ACC2FB61_DALPE|nr:hypothetical protein DPEC_G00311500 [Dallia pectoralis]
MPLEHKLNSRYTPRSVGQGFQLPVPGGVHCPWDQQPGHGLVEGCLAGQSGGGAPLESQKFLDIDPHVPHNVLRSSSLKLCSIACQ